MLMIVNLNAMEVQGLYQLELEYANVTIKQALLKYAIHHA